METRGIPFVLAGVGGVGRALLEAVVAQRELHAERFGIRFDAVAVCDSSGAVTSDGGLTDEQIDAIVAHKAAGNKLISFTGGGTIETPNDFKKGGYKLEGEPQSPEDFLKGVVHRRDLVTFATAPHSNGLGAIMVDCTAGQTTVPAMLAAVKAGGRAVTANKKPVADAPMEVFEQLVLQPLGPARTRYESSVGAGLPAIAAVQRVVAGGDEVSRIAGSFSGTVGYLMSGLQAGGKFSDVVRKAKELGFTEPDPRDDLSGTDVARKALILARTLGMRAQLSDVAVEPLYPAELASLSVPEFMAALPTLDESFRARGEAAAAQGKVVRYAAEVNPPSAANPKGSLKVGLLAVDASSPLGTLTGSDNLVEVYSKWYNETPLVLRGAGAGNGTTAAGVLADMVELAFTSNSFRR